MFTSEDTQGSRKAIIDENIAIPEGMEIGFDHEEDRLGDA